MKNGLFFENDRLVYYKNDHPYHAGVIKENDDIYYISSHGYAVKGYHVVHREMGNGILERGTYKFGDDYKLVKNSYVAPKKAKHKYLRRSKKFDKKFVKKFVKKFDKKFVLAAALLLLFFVSLLIANKYALYSQIANESQVGTTASKKYILPDFTSDVLLCSEAAKLAHDGEITLKEAVRTGEPYRPFIFEYSFGSEAGTLHLSENQEMEDAQEYDLPANETYICIDNLKTGTTYYYQVHVNGQTFSDSFRTANTPRFVSIPGLVNTRDIGGYVNKDGKEVKQGLLIRGVELDGLVKYNYFIPNEELTTVQEAFGFVYDMDLRDPNIYLGDYVSRLNIPHRFYRSPTYGQIFDGGYKENLRQIFSDLADSSKYPMYLHCTLGQDRTGSIILLLQGILNISEEDMLYEYKLTGYTNPELLDYTYLDIILFGMEQYAGTTLNEKIVTFLTTVIGVTETEIESIRSIFLEQ